MKKEKGRLLPRVLMALGAALAVFALAMLLRGGDVLQYCAPAGAPDGKGTEIQALAKAARKLDEAMGDGLSWTTAGGAAAAVSLGAGDHSENCSLVAMGEGWLEVYPRFIVQGRRISESELRRGERVAVLDEGLAFRLFGAELPADARVQLEGREYRAVGTVRHAGGIGGGRGVGDAQEYDAYIPLLAAAADGIRLDALSISALPAGSPGAASAAFEENARALWREDGTMIDLRKETMRRTILPRMVLLIVGLYALAGLFRRMTALCRRWAEGFRRDLKQKYLGALAPKLAGLIALGLLGYGALTGATWLLLSLSAQPLYVFTEWVPENPVAWSAITKVFWNLTTAAGKLVRVGSRELRAVEFWGGLARWGVLLLLLGAALRPRRKPAAK